MKVISGKNKGFTGYVSDQYKSFNKETNKDEILVELVSDEGKDIQVWAFRIEEISVEPYYMALHAHVQIKDIAEEFNVSADKVRRIIHKLNISKNSKRFVFKTYEEKGKMNLIKIHEILRG